MFGCGWWVKAFPTATTDYATSFLPNFTINKKHEWNLVIDFPIWNMYWVEDRLVEQRAPVTYVDQKKRSWNIFQFLKCTWTLHVSISYLCLCSSVFQDECYASRRQDGEMKEWMISYIRAPAPHCDPSQQWPVVSVMRWTLISVKCDQITRDR